jgi:uncharacterized protein YbjT (DUF2867 family)
MKIIVTGSLGNISKPLAKELIEKGHQVTVISSNEDKRKEIEALGGVAAIGSLQEVKFLVSVFTGADAIYAMVPPNFAATDQVAYYRSMAESYTAAISRSAVKRVVHLSSYGAHLSKGTGFILGSHHSEGILRSLSDVALTCVRPTSFYTNLYSFTDMIREQGFIGANYGGNDQIALVHPADIAAAVAQELTRQSTGHDVRYVGSDDRSGSEIARILGAAIGKPDLQWLTFTNEQMADGLAMKGLPPNAVSNLVELGAAIHSGALREDYDKHRPLVMGKIKLEDFVKEFAAAY